MNVSVRLFTDLLTAALVRITFQRCNSPCKDIILKSEIRRRKKDIK